MIMSQNYSDSCITQTNGTTISASMNIMFGDNCNFGFPPYLSSDSSMNSFTLSTSSINFLTATYSESNYYSDSSSYDFCSAKT